MKNKPDTQVKFMPQQQQLLISVAVNETGNRASFI